MEIQCVCGDFLTCFTALPIFSSKSSEFLSPCPACSALSRQCSNLFLWRSITIERCWTYSTALRLRSTELWICYVCFHRIDLNLQMVHVKLQFDFVEPQIFPQAFEFILLRFTFSLRGSQFTTQSSKFVPSCYAGYRWSVRSSENAFCLFCSFLRE